MIYVFHGDDGFSLEEELTALKSQLDTDGMLFTNMTVLDGHSVVPNDIVAPCATAPFLGSHRLIIVDGLLSRFEGGGRFAGKGRDDRKSKEGLAAWKGLPDALAGLPESNILVFVDGKIAASNGLLRLLRPIAEVREFPALRQRDVPDWIRERARKLELKISPPAVALLADLVGNDLRQLAQELEKLATYAQDREIEEKDVGELVSSARESSIFGMVDAIVEGRGEMALRLAQRLRDEGSSSAALLNMVSRQYRHLILSKELLQARLSPEEIGQRLGIRAEYALRKVLEQSRRYSLPQLEEAYRALLAADASVKRGIYDEDLAVDILINDLVDLSRSRSFSRA